MNGEARLRAASLAEWNDVAKSRSKAGASEQGHPRIDSISGATTLVVLFCPARLNATDAVERWDLQVHERHSSTEIALAPFHCHRSVALL